MTPTRPTISTSTPHQARSVGGAAYSYDLNGNLTSGGGRTISWRTDNQPASVTSGGVSESYLYNADSARVKKTRGIVSTYYLEGMWEEDSTGAVRKYYTLAGQVVAMRAVTSTSNTLSYLQGDSLGSVSLTTNASNATVSSQEFDLWGKLRSGGVSQTRRNYTGQILDDSGLLFYNARYYDPGIGRFVSADTIVPGANALTLWPSDSVAGPLFRQGGKDKDGHPTSPEDPQTLNRYSYLENNPLGRSDPTGHCSFKGIFDGTCMSKTKAILVHPNATLGDKFIAVGYGFAQTTLAATGALAAYAGVSAALGAGATTVATSSEITVAEGLEGSKAFVNLLALVKVEILLSLISVSADKQARYEL